MFSNKYTYIKYVFKLFYFLLIVHKMCLESFDKYIDNVAYKTYDTRLSTFKKWKGRLKPEILAGAGFYSISYNDVCKCYYCGVEIYDWIHDDCPIEEHYKFAPTCNLNECLLLNKNKNCKNKNISKCKNLLILVLIYLCFQYIFVIAKCIYISL